MISETIKSSQFIAIAANVDQDKVKMFSSKWLLLMMAVGAMAAAGSADADEAEQPKRAGRQSGWPPGHRSPLPSSAWTSGHLPDFSSNYPSSLAFEIDSPNIQESFQKQYRPTFPQYEESYPLAPHPPAREYIETQT